MAAGAGRRPAAAAAGYGSDDDEDDEDLDELPAKLRRIVQLFQMVPDPMQRYKQLLFYATKLDALDAAFQVEENKVQGCVSQVWVLPTLNEDGTVTFKAESDSQLTKGLAALLCEGLSGATVKEVLAVQPDFVEKLGLKQSLTPSRNNGFLNMLKLMQQKTLLLAAEAERAAPAQEAPESLVAGAGETAPLPAEDETVAASIARKLTEALAPDSLVVEDESHQHAGHGGAKGLRDGETHFRVEVVSAEFEGMNQVKRHRTVYGILQVELREGVHALALSTQTPEEAAARSS